MLTNLKGILLLAAFALSLVVNGQINFKKGYIITNNNDTVFGKVNDGGAFRNAKVCFFKENKKRKIVKYRPGQIKSYRMTGDKYYESKEIEIKDEPKTVFLEVVLKGKVSLYHHWQNRSMAYYMEKDGALIGLQNEEALILHNPDQQNMLLYGPSYFLRNRIYLDTIRYLFKDAKDLSHKISDVQYKEMPLANITKTYLALTCKEDGCIKYERFHKMYKPSMGIYGGARMNQFTFYPNYAGYKEFDSKSFLSYPFGLYFNLPLHTFSDNLSIQVEFLANSIKYKESLRGNQFFNSDVEISSQTIGVPLMLKYKFGGRFIRPSIAAGKEFSYVYSSSVKIDSDDDLLVHHTQKGGWFGEAGLNFKLAKRLSLFANVRIQQNENLIIKKEFENNSYKSILDESNYVRKYSNQQTTVLVGIEF